MSFTAHHLTLTFILSLSPPSSPSSQTSFFRFPPQPRHRKTMAPGCQEATHTDVPAWGGLETLGPRSELLESLTPKDHVGCGTKGCHDFYYRFCRHPMFFQHISGPTRFPRPRQTRSTPFPPLVYKKIARGEMLVATATSN